MAGLTRKIAKIFGSALAPTSNIAKFGSLKAGVPAYSSDPALIQTTEWLSAWNDAVNTVGSRPNIPAKQDMNALGYVLSYQIAYLLTRGLPEYNADTTYDTGDICRIGGIIYQSRIDANTGNAPASSPTQWASFNQAAGASATGQTVTADAAYVDIAWTEDFDTDAAFATNVFTARLAGLYQVSFYIQVDNGTAVPATMETLGRFLKNGVTIAVPARGDSTPTPNGNRWWVQCSALIALAAGDTLKAQFAADDTVGTGDVTLSNGNLSIIRQRAV
jgi:hypothetical protein